MSSWGGGVSFCSLNTAISSAWLSPCLANTGEGDSSATSHLPMCGQSTWEPGGEMFVQWGLQGV